MAATQPQECIDAGECSTPVPCKEPADYLTSCFLECEADCETSLAWNTQGCVEICDESCQAVSPQGTVKITTEDGSEDESEGQMDLAECVKLCSIASECPAFDETFQFDVRQESTQRVPDKTKELQVGGLSEAEQWNVRGSAERARIEEALQDTESAEAKTFTAFIRKLQGVPEDGEDFDDQDLMSFFQGLDPEELGEHGSEEEILRMMQELMSGGMMGYGDSYTDDEMGDSDYQGGYMYDEYQDDF